MSDTNNIARVILRSDGSVHIAFNDFRSIYATAENIFDLFSDPIEFISIKSHAYKDSTLIVNRKRVSLDEVLGLTLATVNSDKQIICDFPELFQHAFGLPDEDKATPLNMKSFEYATVLSDEKSFLLRYYLEFTNNLTSVLTIKNNIKLREEVQFAIVREIINAFFEEGLSEKAHAVDLSTQISDAEESLMLSSEKSKEMLSAKEFAKKKHRANATIIGYLNDNRIPGAAKDEKERWLIPADAEIAD